MKLKLYLEINNITQAEFAKKLRVKQQSISFWCKGNPPKRRNALQIVKLTNGKVTLNDLWGFA